MNLDNRINKISDILTCTDIEEAKQYIGQMGYYADNIGLFNNLAERLYNSLETVVASDLPFRSHGGVGYWRYFIPESRLKPKKKFIPFKYLSELIDAGINVGKVISIRNKNDDIVVSKALVTEINYNNENNEVIDITLGATGYEFSTLFNSYLFQVNGEWRPFGVVEE